jgi:hypothetical protein
MPSSNVTSRVTRIEMPACDAGWGIEPVKEAIRAHPPKAGSGLLDYGKKA